MDGSALLMSPAIWLIICQAVPCSLVDLQVQARLDECLTVFADLVQRLLILVLAIIAIDLYGWVACTFVTFGGLVTDVK